MKKIWMCLALGLLSGCLGGRSQPAEVYTLDVIPAVESIEQVRLSINVASVQLPKYLDRPQMVVREKGQTDVKVLEKSRWVEPLADVMPRILAGDLSSSLPNSIVKQRTLANEKFDYSVSVDITQFVISLGTEIKMGGWWSLVGHDGQVIVREKIDFSTPVSEKYADVAKKQSVLIRKLADQISQRIKKVRS